MTYIYASTDLGINSSGGLVSINELSAMKELGEETNNDVITFDFKDLHPTVFGLPDLPLLIDYIMMGKLLKMDLSQIKIAHFYGGSYSNTIQYLKSKNIKTTFTLMWHDRNVSITEHEKFFGRYPYDYVRDDVIFNMFTEGIRHADVVIAAGSAPRNNMLNEGAKRVDIIPLGCDIPDENKIIKLPLQEFRVGYLGQCLLPDSPILTLNRGLQKIKDIKIGDKVLTHKGRFMKVSQVMKREYYGDMIKIIPSNIRTSIILTPEHKVLAVKTSSCISRPNRYNVSVCRPDKKCYFEKDGRRYKNCKYLSGEEPFTKYKTEWIESRNLQKGDFVTYPKAKEKEVDIDKIRILDYIDDCLNITGDYYGSGRQMDIFGDVVEKKISMMAPYSRKYAQIPAEVKLTKDLMRLFGYFIAEGDISEGRKTRFTFHINETEYHRDVENIMKNTFGLDAEHEINNENNSHRLGYSNKVLSNMFQNMFAPLELQTKTGPGCKANIVRIPSEFLNLPLDKLAELVKGEWRGDGSDYDKTNQYNITTTSETLAHQLIYILSKFGILASLKTSLSKIEGHEDKYDVIISSGDNETFESIIGEKLTRFGINHYSQTYLKGNKLFYIQIRDIEILDYNGDVWNLEVEEDNSYISCIALHNCGPDKGLYYLIKAWEKLNYQDGSKLIFAGPNTEKILPNFINAFAKAGNFNILGYVNNVIDFYNSINVYIQPSATEAFGMEVPEALSFGCPVICSDGAGAADCITNGEDGFIVSAMNFEAIADKIQYFKNNPKEIERMGKNARIKSLNYTWEHTKDKYIKLWKNLLNE